MKIIRYSDTINEAIKTRGDITTLVVKIGDKTFFNKEASITFYQVIEYISQNVGVDKFIKDNIESSISGRKIIGLKPEDFPTYAKQGLKQSSKDKFIISTHSSTEVKKSILEYLLKFYNIEGTVEIRNRIEKQPSDIINDINLTDDLEEFENKGEYSDEELKSKLINLLKSNLTIVPKFIIFLKILLSENKKFTREEIKKKLTEKVNSVDFSNPSRKFSSEGQAGVYISHFSQFITKSTNDYLRQIIDYDTIRWSPEAETDIGAKKDNYQIVDKYRNLLSEVLSEVGVDVIPDFIESETEDDNFIEPFSKRFGIPTDFKAVQAEDEKIEKTYKSEDYSINPFRQAICVLGKSGAGKSYTIDEILEKDGEDRPHKYEFIIPSASTTGLLSQFSPSAKDGRGGYIPSRLGKLIENAYKNKNNLYTIVLDECHKSNIIEMINDELLQAISTGRNKNRFISLDDETSDLYPSKFLDKRNNIIIPENLGFIFISSNARVIAGNEDFFNRVDLVELKEEDRDRVKTIDDLNIKRVEKTDDKYDLVSKIMAYTGRKN